MAQEEITSLEPELARLEEHLKVLLLPKDPTTTATWCSKSAPARRR